MGKQPLGAATFSVLALFLLGGCTQSGQVYSSPQSEETPPQTPQNLAATEQPSNPNSSSAQTVEVDASTNQLAELLKLLAIEPEAGAGYDRDLFEHWIDADSDGCNTRREVLIAEARVSPQVTSDCDLLGGSWISNYDNVLTADFSTLDIDHLVPLKEAWDSGAHAWDYETRRRFANDLGFGGSLIAVTAASNRSKSDRDPAQWLPSEESYLCQYTADWLSVKYRWQLSVDSAESLALGSLVIACDEFEVELPQLAEINFGKALNKDSAGNDPKFSSCKEAKGNGFGPYQKGLDPEYEWYRDGDSDGTVCE